MKFWILGIATIFVCWLICSIVGRRIDRDSALQAVLETPHLQEMTFFMSNKTGDVFIITAKKIK